jgi:hypothetical protein
LAALNVGRVDTLLVHASIGDRRTAWFGADAIPVASTAEANSDSASLRREARVLWGSRFAPRVRIAPEDPLAADDVERIPEHTVAELVGARRR